MIGKYAAWGTVKHDQGFKLASSKIFNDLINKFNRVFIFQHFTKIDSNGLE